MGEAALPLTIDNERTYICPKKPLCQNPWYYQELLWLHRQYTKGFLPDEGGLKSQPAKLIESFKVIDDAQAAADEERERRERQKQAAAKQQQQAAGS